MEVPFLHFYIFSCIISACCCLLLKEICMEELGCFRITEDFLSEYRPVNLLPQPLSVLKTVFSLYTRKNPEKPQVISYKSPSSIASSHFNSSHETKILIHGYLDNMFFTSWTKRMKHELLLFEDMNVILVDAHRGNRFPYIQAVANARVIGAEIARLIQVMEDTTSTSRTLFHLIGHSLGAHTAGYAGKRLVNLSRITGLDPSGPLFQYMPASVRLDETDADFVDVIHTDKIKTTADIYLWIKDYFTGKRLGMSQLQGDIDIFLNDGTEQPGCDFSQPIESTDDAMLYDFGHLWSCSHLRALDFMIYSINLSTVLPVAYQCSSWEEFLKGKCADCGKSAEKCVVVGLRAERNKVFRNKAATPFYIKTSGINPFWIYHYQLELKVLKANSTGHGGRIDLTLKGSENRETFQLNNNLIIRLQPGEVHDFLITTEKRLGNLLSLSLKWSPFRQTSNLSEKSSKIIEYITVTMMNIIEKSPRKESKKKFCGDPSGSFFQVC